MSKTRGIDKTSTNRVTIYPKNAPLMLLCYIALNLQLVYLLYSAVIYLHQNVQRAHLCSISVLS